MQLLEASKKSLLDSALYYASIGYPVLPLHNPVRKKRTVFCSCSDGRDCSKIAKHPRTRFGHKEATTDEAVIRAWWDKRPQANIGLLTGVESGLLVLDVDVKDGGQYSLDELEDDYRAALKNKFESVSGTLTADSGSGGQHYYFKYPLDYRIGGSASLIGQGLDIRAEGNYIIAPPSRHQSGGEYSWFGINTPIEDAPSWLIYEILTAEKTQREVSIGSGNITSGKKILTEKIKAGGGNTYLFGQVRGLINSFTEEEVLKRALERNQTDLERPLPEKEVQRMVKFAYRKYKSQRNLGLKK
jgi:putative DNA primase/helicase